jgi:hypothetical protein
MRTWLALVLAALSGTIAQAQSDTNQIMGQLGYVVGTDLTIEGTFKAGKNSWLLVTKVNGKDLPEPRLIPTDNLDTSAKIPTNALCRFKGVEITYVVKSVVDPKTGQECQQASPGRHIDFQITEVLAPEGVKVRQKKGPNQAPEDTARKLADPQR